MATETIKRLSREERELVADQLERFGSRDCVGPREDSCIGAALPVVESCLYCNAERVAQLIKDELEAALLDAERGESGIRAKVGEALDLLYTDNGWDAACRLLADIAGRSTVKDDAMAKTRPVSIGGIALGPDQPFEVALPDEALRPDGSCRSCGGELDAAPAGRQEEAEYTDEQMAAWRKRHETRCRASRPEPWAYGDGPQVITQCDLDSGHEGGHVFKGAVQPTPASRAALVAQLERAKRMQMFDVEGATVRVPVSVVDQLIAALQADAALVAPYARLRQMIALEIHQQRAYAESTAPSAGMTTPGEHRHTAGVLESILRLTDFTESASLAVDPPVRDVISRALMLLTNTGGFDQNASAAWMRERADVVRELDALSSRDTGTTP